MRLNWKILLILPLSFAILFGGCEEETPEIHFEEEQGDDGDPGEDPEPIEEQERRVLLDYFTGVRCPNCPGAMETAERLRSNNDERVIIASYHYSQNFAYPHEESQYDFRLDENSDLIDYLGTASGLPVGTVNRAEAPSGDRLTGTGQWSSVVDQELEEPPKAALELNPEFDDPQASLDVEVHYLESIEDAHNITVMVAENGIEDWQLNTNEWQEDYVHNHVIQHFLTSFRGEGVGENVEEDNVKQRSFSFELGDEKIDSDEYDSGITDPDNAHWIVALHYDNAEKRNIIQTLQAPLKE